jgi:hypothetical protein
MSGDTYICDRCGRAQTYDDVQRYHGNILACRYQLDCSTYRYLRDREIHVPESTTDPDQFIKKAKAMVIHAYELIEDKPLTDDEVYIVWFAKTLGNWKALASTTRTDGLYFEITYDGNKNQTYVDTYVKFFNLAVTDDGYSDFVNTI